MFLGLYVDVRIPHLRGTPPRRPLTPSTNDRSACSCAVYQFACHRRRRQLSRPFGSRGGISDGVIINTRGKWRTPPPQTTLEPARRPTKANNENNNTSWASVPRFLWTRLAAPRYLCVTQVYIVFIYLESNTILLLLPPRE